MSLTITVTVAHRLKIETEEAHVKTEQILSPRMTSIKNYDDYALILKMFYGYFSVLDKSIGDFITTNVLPDIRERRNSFFILKDLEAIGYSTKSIPVCVNVPSIDSVEEALGAMYVLEGSTLGGRMISKMLIKNTSAVFNDSNLNFFNGYKEDTGNKWKLFVSTLDRYDRDADKIIDTANTTFECLTKWMEHSL